MHENSIQAFQELDADTKRAKILQVYVNHKTPLTDRAVMYKLDFGDMNMVRPRITELAQDNRIVEVGKTKDSFTRKTVRMCKFVEDRTCKQLSLF